MPLVESELRLDLPSGRRIVLNLDSVPLRSEQHRFSNWPVALFHPTISRLIDLDDMSSADTLVGAFTGCSVADVLDHRCDWSTADQAEFSRWIHRIEPELFEVACPRLNDWSDASRFTEQVPSQTFTSPLEHAVRGLQLNRAGAAQWRSTLKNLPGIRRDELEWSRLVERLVNDEVILDREQILAWLHGCRTRLVLGYETEIAFDPSFEFEAGQGSVAMRLKSRRRHKPYAIGEIHLRNRTLGYKIAFAEFTDLLNPRCNWFALSEHNEIIAASPASLAALTSGDATRAARDDVVRRFSGYGRDTPSPQYSQFVLSGGTQYREWLLVLPDLLPGFSSEHFQTPNVLLHLRTTVRRHVTGIRVLFVEELQSDWHQTGRREGYGFGGDAVMPAPFAKEWPALGLKCALHIAATQGLDAVGLIPGYVHLERYAAPRELEYFYDAILPRDLSELVRPFGGQLERLSVRATTASCYLMRQELRWRAVDGHGRGVSPLFQRETDAWRWMHRHMPTRDVEFPYVRLTAALRDALLADGISRYGTLRFGSCG